MKRIIILTILISIYNCVSSQIHNHLFTNNYSWSPSEARYSKFISNIDSRLLDAEYSNPAFYSTKRDSIKIPSFISSSYSTGELDGDYLISEGNQFTDYAISGKGSTILPKMGTLYGQMHFVNGEHKNIGWNAIRHPELYAPYLCTDSAGGNFKFKEYFLLGGYSITINKWHLGIEASYRGEQAHRVTDPRTLNTTSWVDAKIGIGRYLKNHLLMFDVGYQKNKQHLTMRYWRPGQQERFFIGYGFGMYDLEKSIVTFGYSRMYYINKGSVGINYKSPELNKFRSHLRFEYHLSNMNTEEFFNGKILDLYSYDEKKLKSTLAFTYQASTSLNLAFIFNNTTNLREGSENIFFSKLVDSVNWVYDYEHIDIQPNYNSTKSDNILCFKTSYTLNSYHKISGLIGNIYQFREETYKVNKYILRITSTNPYIGIEYAYNNEANSFTINANIAQKMIMDSLYHVSLPVTDNEYMDFQQAFTPYAFYNSEYTSLQLNATYERKLKKYKVGINFRLLFTRGDRDENTIYSNPVSLPSPAPIIDPNPDRHNETWGSLTLFFVL